MQGIKLFLALGVVALASACGQRQAEEEVVFVQPEPISMEPTYTGKYK